MQDINTLKDFVRDALLCTQIDETVKGCLRKLQVDRWGGTPDKEFHTYGVKEVRYDGNGVTDWNVFEHRVVAFSHSDDSAVNIYTFEDFGESDGTGTLEILCRVFTGEDSYLIHVNEDRMANIQHCRIRGYQIFLITNDGRRPWISIFGEEKLTERIVNLSA